MKPDIENIFLNLKIEETRNKPNLTVRLVIYFHSKDSDFFLYTQDCVNFFIQQSPYYYKTAYSPLVEKIQGKMV
mgnify:CR=1 FL=1